jgi:hypothetical protein
MMMMTKMMRRSQLPMALMTTMMMKMMKTTKTAKMTTMMSHRYSQIYMFQML